MEFFNITISNVFFIAGAPFSGDEKTDRERIQMIPVDQGINFTLPCGAAKVGDSSSSVMWIHEDSKDIGVKYRILGDGSIFFSNIKQSDSGTCMAYLQWKLYRFGVLKFYLGFL